MGVSWRASSSNTAGVWEIYYKFDWIIYLRACTLASEHYEFIVKIYAQDKEHDKIVSSINYLRVIDLVCRLICERFRASQIFSAWQKSHYF